MNKSAGSPHGNLFANTWNISRVHADPSVPDYLSLAVSQLRAEAEVNFDVFLRTRKGKENAIDYTLCCSKGERFAAAWIEQLQERGIERVYFRRSDLGQALIYLNFHVPQVLAHDTLSLAQKTEHVLNITHLWVEFFFTQPTFQDPAQLKIGLKYVDYLLDCVRQDQYHRTWLLDLYRHDRTIYGHCVNTGLLTIGMAKHLGWSDTKIRNLSLGALLHDLGLRRVPQDILHKTGVLTPDEMEEIRKHPRWGYQLLKNFSFLSQEALKAVFHHHENGDGSGYPEGLTLPLIPTSARLLRIIDSYDALTSHRSWRGPYDPVKALWIMRQEWHESGYFDVGLLAEFIKFLSVEKAARPRPDSQDQEDSRF